MDGDDEGVEVGIAVGLSVGVAVGISVGDDGALVGISLSQSPRSGPSIHPSGTLQFQFRRDGVLTDMALQAWVL